ncbi:uncharacterized protein AstC [Panulirus ornatus]|uniref:uncharacterized protein AstC n=1 Tax=Panulirus ornatus TaxID=150431 RepID=UPI003A87C76C
MHMMPCAAHLLLAALALALTQALPAPEGNTHHTPTTSVIHQHQQDAARIRKRAITSSTARTDEEIAALKDLILARVVSDLQDSWQDLPSLKKALGEEQLQEEEAIKSKRMFAPLSALPGELPTIKRQIRYHQCYFNPISCFRRK